jgi:hypothetical protein
MRHLFFLVNLEIYYLPTKKGIADKFGPRVFDNLDTTM